jgi:hypothetical protein
MAVMNEERRQIAAHLKEQATRYRQFAAGLQDARAAALMTRLAADFDERAFDLLYEDEIARRAHAA